MTSGVPYLNKVFIVKKKKEKKLMQTKGNKESSLLTASVFCFFFLPSKTLVTISRNGLVIKSLDSQSRGPVFKTTGWLK